MEEKPQDMEECLELKNLKYKSMLLNGNGNLLKETKTTNNLSNLDHFLENEKLNNVNEPWNKLDKTVKTKKLIEYVEVYKKTHNLEEEEEKVMVLFFKDCLDRKKLQRVKDVVYDKENGIIKDIPSLAYVKANKHFTLKNLDKRVSTHKCLTPKKILNGTIKNKTTDS
jgi:hypothetical protein